jgi:hypothetical protein
MEESTPCFSCKPPDRDAAKNPCRSAKVVGNLDGSYFLYIILDDDSVRNSCSKDEEVTLRCDSYFNIPRAFPLSPTCLSLSPRAATTSKPKEYFPIFRIVRILVLFSLCLVLISRKSI